MRCLRPAAGLNASGRAFALEARHHPRCPTLSLPSSQHESRTANSRRLDAVDLGDCSQSRRAAANLAWKRTFRHGTLHPGCLRTRTPAGVVLLTVMLLGVWPARVCGPRAGSALLLRMRDCPCLHGTVARCARCPRHVADL